MYARGILLALLTLTQLQAVAYLPAGATVNAIASGAPIVAGQLNNGGFIAESTRILYTGPDPISALALDPAGNIYAAATSASPAHASVVKLSPQGVVLYRTVLDATETYARALTVNAKGEALLSGQLVETAGATFVATPGTVSGDSSVNTGFLLQLDAAGTPKLAIRGFGLGPVAYDAADNIYVAGAVYGNAPINPTPGAFQPTHEQRACAGTSMLGIACAYQSIMKISADGKRVLYSTFVTGAHGAQPAALFVDSAGNAIVAGTTNSPDYPVTPGVFQSTYRAANQPPPIFGPHPQVYPPPSSGYLTKLNADGTALLWSTLFSGTGAETVTSFHRDAQGNFWIAGRSASIDLPGAQTLPAGCIPRSGREIPYAARLSADGSTLIQSRYIYSFDGDAVPRITTLSDGSPVIAAGDAIDSSAPGALACIFDPTDNFFLNRAAPGQLITLFADRFDADAATVTIDGITAPLLYRSTQQINAQVPPELAGKDVVTVTVQSPKAPAMSRELRIVPRAPSAFLMIEQFDPASTWLICNGGGFSPAFPPVARNQDDTLNSCAHPAPSGSIITLYFNGIGLTTPTVSMQDPLAGSILDFAPDPNAPGVWRMRVQLPRSGAASTLIPIIDGAALRRPYLGILVSN